MDDVQYKRLVDAVKWAIDDSRWQQGKWEQQHWGLGNINPTTPLVTATSGTKFRPVTCTTGCCIAGNITQAHGDLFVVPASTKQEEYDGEMEPISVTNCLTKENRVHMGIEERAMELLGVNYDDLTEYSLFDGDNDLERVIEHAHGIAARHGYALEEQIPEILYADLI